MRQVRQIGSYPRPKQGRSAVETRGSRLHGAAARSMVMAQCFSSVRSEADLPDSSTSKAMQGIGILAGAKTAPTGAAIVTETGHDMMCLEVLAFSEAVLSNKLASRRLCMPPGLRVTFVARARLPLAQNWSGSGHKNATNLV